jgi:uncharacterized protein YuzE
VTDKPKATYDKEADAIGIYFAPDGAVYESSQEVAPGVVIDYDAAGRVIGVELSNVSKLLATRTTDVADEEPAPGRAAE